MFMKKILAAAAMALVSAGAFAQSDILLDNPENEIYIGVRAGLDISSATPSGFDNSAGFSIGGIVNVPLYKNFYIEPGIGIFYNTVGVDTKGLESEYPDADIDASLRFLGVRIPVVAGYHFDFTPDLNVAVFTGPEMNIGTSGKYHLNVNGESGSESVYGSGGTFKRFDMDWKFGVGVNYRQFHFDVAGGVGMIDISKNMPGEKFRLNRVSFTLGYNF